MKVDMPLNKESKPNLSFLIFIQNFFRLEVFTLNSDFTNLLMCKSSQHSIFKNQKMTLEVFFVCFLLFFHLFACLFFWEVFLINILPLVSFFYTSFFFFSLNDSKSLQISITPLNILADFKNVVVCIVLILPLILLLLLLFVVVVTCTLLNQLGMWNICLLSKRNQLFFVSSSFSCESELLTHLIIQIIIKYRIDIFILETPFLFLF